VGWAANFLPHPCSSESGKYSAAVASVSWLTDAAYPLRVHKVFRRFQNFRLSQNLLPPALADFIRGPFF